MGLCFSPAQLPCKGIEQPLDACKVKLMTGLPVHLGDITPLLNKDI